jgi:hypothetical protein
MKSTLERTLLSLSALAMLTAATVGLLSTTLLPFEVQAARPETDPKVRICHRTASHTNQYTNPEVDADSVDGDTGNDNGQGDHYLEHVGPIWFSGIQGEWGDIIPPAGNHSGLNWTTQGQAIWNNSCNMPSASPSPSPSASPTPTPETNRSSKLSHTGPFCHENVFDVSYEVKRDGVAEEGVTVTITYNSQQKTAVTNSEGWVKIAFNFTGAGDIIAEAEGHDAVRTYLTGECVNVTLDPTQHAGSVLGASTMAGTGVAADILVDILGGAGAMLTMAGSILKNRKQA